MKDNKTLVRVVVVLLIIAMVLPLLVQGLSFIIQWSRKIGSKNFSNIGQISSKSTKKK